MPLVQVFSSWALSLWQEIWRINIIISDHGAPCFTLTMLYDPFLVQQTDRAVWQVCPALSDKQSAVFVQSTVVVTPSKYWGYHFYHENENLRAADSITLIWVTFIHLSDLLPVNLTEICFKAEVVWINALVFRFDRPHLLVVIVPELKHIL